MTKLVESYLAFARGEGREAIEPTALGPSSRACASGPSAAASALEISMEKP